MYPMFTFAGKTGTRPPEDKDAKYRCTNCKRDYITAPYQGTKNKCPFCLEKTLVLKVG